MSYLRGFAPWIVYAVLSALGWQWGALAALIAGTASFVADRRNGVTLDAQFLDLGSIVYFACLAGLAFADPTSPIQRFDGPLSSAWLAMIAVASMLLRHPFTEGIARRQVSAEIANGPGFARTNMVITSFWAGGFLFGAVAGTITSALSAGTVIDIARQVLAFAIPMYLTHRYVAGLRREIHKAAPVATAA
jgi:hypothetical protein